MARLVVAVLSLLVALSAVANEQLIRRSVEPISG